MDQKPDEARSFAEESGRPQYSFLGELWAFLRNNKKWWMLPILIALILIGLLIVLASSKAALLIYPLF